MDEYNHRFSGVLRRAEDTTPLLGIQAPGEAFGVTPSR
jgi:hypothetical protein